MNQPDGEEVRRVEAIRERWLREFIDGLLHRDWRGRAWRGRRGGRRRAAQMAGRPVVAFAGSPPEAQP